MAVPREREPLACSSHDDAENAVADREHDETAALRREVSGLRREILELVAERREARHETTTLLALVAHQLRGPLLPLEVSVDTLERALVMRKHVPEDVLPRM